MMSTIWAAQLYSKWTVASGVGAFFGHTGHGNERLLFGKTDLCAMTTDGEGRR
jgi:hypothetical protein